jgi:hypothetical protein
MARSAIVFNNDNRSRRNIIVNGDQASSMYMARSLPRRQGGTSQQDENIRDEAVDRNEVDNQTTIAQLLELRIQLAQL